MYLFRRPALQYDILKCFVSYLFFFYFFKKLQSIVCEEYSRGIEKECSVHALVIIAPLASVVQWTFSKTCFIPDVAKKNLRKTKQNCIILTNTNFKVTRSKPNEKKKNQVKILYVTIFGHFWSLFNLLHSSAVTITVVQISLIDCMSGSQVFWWAQYLFLPNAVNMTTGEHFH